MNAITAVYVRVSTRDQRTTDSQVRELKRYCQQRGWSKLEFFTDKTSGDRSSRPELDRLMGEVRSGRIERVVAYKLDRLGRSLTHLCLLIDELARAGIPLVASLQGIDTSSDSPAGKLQLSVLAAICEFERGLIKERVNAGLAAARERGVKLGRPNTLKGRSGEVLALREQGLGVRAIARELEMPVASVFKLLNSKNKEK